MVGSKFLLPNSRIRPLLLQPASSFHKHVKNYSQKRGNELRGVVGAGERARSTAEEFERVAEEKAAAATETAKEAWESAKEAVAGQSELESEAAKQRYKEKVEKGNYDKIGHD